MREPTENEQAFVRETFNDVLARNGITRWRGDMVNPYMIDIQLPVSCGKAKAEETFNDLFHALGVLPAENTLRIGDAHDYCLICANADGETFSGTFNVPFSKDFREEDEEYQFTIKAILEQDEREAQEEEAEIAELIEGIEAGRIKSKSPDGYLVLAGEPYDAIESGEKKIEYRDFTEYNLKRTIGIKTVRFNRGYKKNAPQMQWEVTKVALEDGAGGECDPSGVPDDFWPVRIAIHLGKRIK